MNTETDSNNRLEQTYFYDLSNRGTLDLYRRKNIPGIGTDVLDCISQVPFNKSIENSVKDAIYKIFEHLNLPKGVKITAYHLMNRFSNVEYRPVELEKILGTYNLE